MWEENVTTFTINLHILKCQWRGVERASVQPHRAFAYTLGINGPLFTANRDWPKKVLLDSAPAATVQLALNLVTEPFG